MGKFTRAVNAVLLAEKITQAELAARAQLAPTVLSRLLSDERPCYADHAAAIIRALEKESDREHCLQAWLTDECPEEYRDRLVVHFGQLREDRTQVGDQLERDLRILEEYATGDKDLRNLLRNLAAIVTPDPPSPNFARRHPGQTQAENPTAGQKLEDLIPHAKAAIALGSSLSRVSEADGA